MVDVAMTDMPCRDPEFREQIRDVHIFIYRSLMLLKRQGVLSESDEKMMALALATMKECEKCILGISKE